MSRYQWYVPIEYMTGDEIEFAWLKPHDTVLIEFDFSDLDSFIRLNMNSAGYYIVNYSFDLNERLTKHIGAEVNYKVSLTFIRTFLIFIPSNNQSALITPH